MHCEATGKEILTSWALAQRTARNQRRRRGTVVAPYRCGSHYHTGSSVGGSDRDHRSRMAARRRIEQRWETEW